MCMRCMDVHEVHGCAWMGMRCMEVVRCMGVHGVLGLHEVHGCA